MGLKTLAANQSKRKRDTTTNPPELLQEILVWEILVRLPVETLVRFKTVSKAWHAIISDAAFVHAHLIYSRQTPEQHQKFLITPHVFLDPNKRGPAKPLSTDIRFYQRQLVQDNIEDNAEDSATLLYGRHFPAGEFRTVNCMAHCDGLVLLPTNTKAYIFNPAIRDAIVLPESHRNVLPLRRTCLPIGLGLDASTGRYKVARAFYRPSNDDPSKIVAMGMEVFTINNCQQDNNGSCWRETLEDPPLFMLTRQTAPHCKGCLFFFIDKKNQKYPVPPQGLLRFRLDNETFGVLPLLPNVYPRVEDKDLVVSELDGELCVSFFSKPMQRLLIWVTRDILIDDPHWSCRYMIHVPDQCRPIMASSLGSASAGFIVLRGGDCVLRYDLEGQEVKDHEYLFGMDEMWYLGPNKQDTLGLLGWQKCAFNLIAYTPSLVPLASKSKETCLQALLQ